MAADPTINNPTDDRSLGGQITRVDQANITDEASLGSQLVGAGSVGTTLTGGTGVAANNATITITVTANGSDPISDTFTTDQATGDTLTYDLSTQIDTLIQTALGNFDPMVMQNPTVTNAEYTAPTGTNDGFIDFTFSDPITASNVGATGNVIRVTLSGLSGGGGGTTTGVTLTQVEAAIAASTLFVRSINITDGSDTVSATPDTNGLASLNISTLIPAAITDAITEITSTDSTVALTRTGASVDVQSRPKLRGNNNTVADTSLDTLTASETGLFAELILDSSSGLAIVERGSGVFAIVGQGSTPVIPVNPTESATITGDSSALDAAVPVVLTVTAENTITETNSISVTLDPAVGTTNVDLTNDSTVNTVGTTSTITLPAADAADPGTYTIEVTPSTADGALDTVSESVIRFIPYIWFRTNAPTTTGDISSAPGASTEKWPANNTVSVPVGTGSLFLAVDARQVPAGTNRAVYTNGAQAFTNVRTVGTPIAVTIGTVTVNYQVFQFSGALSGGTLSMFQEL